jgi:heme-degrading monooxygenase HmoA
VITRAWRGLGAGCSRSEMLAALPLRGPARAAGVAGFEGARLLRRTTGDETEFVSLTFFDDLDAVRAFAGPDYETAVVADEAREVLVRFDDHVGHYETAFEIS